MIKKLICKLFDHKIDPFSIVEYAMANEIKCCRCGCCLTSGFLNKQWKKSKCSGETIYSYKDLKNAIRRYKNRTNSSCNMPSPKENSIEYYMDK